MHLILCVRFPGTIFDWEKGSIAEEFQHFLQDSKLYEGRTMSVLVCIRHSQLVALYWAHGSFSINTVG